MNIEVWAPEATNVWLCLFDDNDCETRHELTRRDGEYWIGDIAGVHAGDRYGLRATGNNPNFNPEKLLIDPWAQELEAPLHWDPMMAGVLLVTAHLLYRSAWYRLHPIPLLTPPVIARIIPGRI